MYLIIFFTTVLSMSSCVDQEKLLYDQYINLSEPNYHGDSVRMFKILKIHKKLYKKHPDNLIYFGNVFQSNCSLGNYEENIALINESILPDDPDINSRVYKNFYLALNEYRNDRNSNYQVYLEKLLEENLDHNPLLGYIAARCTNNESLADHYYPLMQEYIFAMPEKRTIDRMIASDKCDRFLELYRGICPVCEICYKRYPI